MQFFRLLRAVTTLAKVCAKSSALHALSSGAYSVRSVHNYLVSFVLFKRERRGEAGRYFRSCWPGRGWWALCGWVMGSGLWRRTVAGLIHIGEIYRAGCGVAQIGCGVAQLGCGVAQKGAVWLRRVRYGSDSSAPACCTAGPSSNLGSAPQRRPSTEREAMRTTRVVLYE